MLPEGLRLLVVEHNSILALDVEDMLLRNGAAQVEVASSCVEALARLESGIFDAALLDLALAESDNLAVAITLQAANIPFAFAVGYGERATLPPRFADKLVIGKPYSESYLLARLAELLKTAA